MGDTIKNILSKIYYNPSQPGSYSSAEALFQEARKLLNNLTLKEVKEWLQSQIVYTLHRAVRKNFKRNPVVAEYVDENFQADLIDMQKYSKENDAFKFILTVIDVFSKYAFAVPIKNKNGASVSNAMKKVFLKRIPIKLQTDQGKEFLNASFKSLMKEFDIYHFTSKNKKIKCAVVERFNKTLNQKLHKYFTKSGSSRYINILDKFIDGYNKTIHRSIGMAPNEVSESNKDIVFEKLYGYKSRREMLKKRASTKLKNGDNVRIKYEIGPLDRGYYPNWSDNTYEIINTMTKSKVPLFKLKGSDNKVIDRRFYKEEIQKVSNNIQFRIEKILKKKKTKGKTLYFVKWLNHPSSENSWVESNNIVNINSK